MELKPDSLTKTVAVILAGGEGKRLWPVSTADNPKQLNTLFSDKSMLQDTYERACQIFPRENVVVVTTEMLANDTRKLLALSDKNIIVQPKNADTAAAMSITALHLDALFPESVAVLLYSDHQIAKPDEFAHEVQHAINLAKLYDEPIAIGTLPTSANVELGYIALGKPTDIANLYHVKAFHEKPNKETAEQYLRAGNYVWNTGVKVWKIASLLKTIKKLQPDVYATMVRLRAAIGTDEYQPLLHQWFDEIIPQSFEITISERLTNLLVYIADYQWKDMGSWEVFYELAKKDSNGNAIRGQLPQQEVTLIDSEGCLIVPRQKHIAVIGLKDIVIVQSENRLLVCRKDLAGRVKEVIQ